jgi:hypothetical protein
MSLRFLLLVGGAGLRGEGKQRQEAQAKEDEKPHRW